MQQANDPARCDVCGALNDRSNDECVACCFRRDDRPTEHEQSSEPDEEADVFVFTDRAHASWGGYVHAADPAKVARLVAAGRLVPCVYDSTNESYGHGPGHYHPVWSCEHGWGGDPTEWEPVKGS